MKIFKSMKMNLPFSGLDSEMLSCSCSKPGIALHHFGFDSFEFNFKARVKFVFFNSC